MDRRRRMHAKREGGGREGSRGGRWDERVAGTEAGGGASKREREAEQEGESNTSKPQRQERLIRQGEGFVFCLLCPTISPHGREEPACWHGPHLLLLSRSHSVSRSLRQESQLTTHSLGDPPGRQAGRQGGRPVG